MLILAVSNSCSRLQEAPNNVGVRGVEQNKKLNDVHVWISPLDYSTDFVLWRQKLCSLEGLGFITVTQLAPSCGLETAGQLKLNLQKCFLCMLVTLCIFLLFFDNCFHFPSLYSSQSSEKQYMKTRWDWLSQDSICAYCHHTHSG